MCLVLFAYDYHPKYLLILGANRDEYYARPAEQAHFWGEDQRVLAGRDLKGAGTWLGITRDGRLAAVTNYRDPTAIKTNAISRGLLVKEYLRSFIRPYDYLAIVDRVKHQYNGFNLILMDRISMWYYSNRAGRIKRIGAGIHGLSNSLLNASWPKVVKGKEALRRSLELDAGVSIERLLDVLSDCQQAKDEELPCTGVSLEWERLLSSAFIKGQNYGTRTSTVILIDRYGRVQFYERSFTVGGKQLGSDVFYEFEILKQNYS